MVKRSPLDLGDKKLFSTMPVRPHESPLSVADVLLDSPMLDVPEGGGELAWGLPLWSDFVPKTYIRMDPDFTLPMVGEPGDPSVALDPQVSPPTGRFPIEVLAVVEHVDLEFVVFV